MKNVCRIGILGNFGGNIIGGQVQKTRDLKQALDERYEEIYSVDVYKKNVCQIFIGILKLFIQSDKVIVILSSPGYFKILWFITLLNFLLKKEIFEIVIGGVRYKSLVKKPIRFFCERRISKIYVESTYMINMYKKINLRNVEKMPNFKPLKADQILVRNKLDDENPDILKVCTFSRIDRKKGIDTAIDIVCTANRRKVNYILDIYGPIDEDIKVEFEQKINETETYIQYKGPVYEDISQVLSKYDILLFPTHWETEGFPGTFIDAMHSGLVILASYKENFRDIIVDDENGWLIPEYDEEEFVNKLYLLYSDRRMLKDMKEKSLQESFKYDCHNALMPLFIELDK